MNQKTLLGLIVIALIVIVAAVAIHHANQPLSETAETSHKLVPDLKAHINDIDKVVFTGAGNKTIATLHRGKDGWTVAEKGGYAADVGKLREFLLKLANATVIENKTSDKARYDAIGVRDVADKDAKGVEVEIDGAGQPIKLIVGAPDSRGSGTFVRRVGDAQSLLVSGRLSAEKNTSDWLNKNLVDIPANRIADVTITRPDGQIVQVDKDAKGDADFTLTDLPKGREAAASYTVNGVATTLADLRLEDVLPAGEAAPAADAIKASYATFDGLVVDVGAWSKDGKDYAQLKASADRERAEKNIAAEQEDAMAKAAAQDKATDANKKDAASKAGAASAGAATKEDKTGAANREPLAVANPAKDKADKLAALDKEAADLNARFDGWTYVLPSYKYSNIDKSMDDLLKPLEAKAKPQKGENHGKAPKKRSKARSH
ncbi:MAG: DUF4340 domain-containing protein [Rhodanobacteraceae bacterium]